MFALYRLDKWLLVAGGMFFELLFDGFDGYIEGFLEGVRCFAGYDFAILWDGDTDGYFLVEGGFRLDEVEVDIEGVNLGVTTSDALCFLVDKVYEAVCNLEVDGFDTYVHGSSFLMARGCAC